MKIYLALLAVALTAAFGCTLGGADGADVADIDMPPIPREFEKLANVSEEPAAPMPKTVYRRIMEAVETGDGYALYKLAECSTCIKHLHRDPLVSSRCSKNPNCFEGWICSEACTDTCLDCHLPEQISERDTLLNDAIDVIERKSWMPSVLEPTLRTYVSYFPRFMREVADTLEQAAGDLKEGGHRRLLERAFENAKLGHAVSAPIWGVTVLELHTRDKPKGGNGAAEDLKGKSQNEGSRQPLADFTRLSQTPGKDELQKLGLRILLLDYVSPSRLFPDDTEVRSIDEELHSEITGKGGVHARAVFLSQLAKVRTLALKALPNIRINTVSVGILSKSSNPLQAIASCLSGWCSWNWGTANLDISVNVVSWLRSLADAIERRLNRLLKSEPALQRAKADRWILRITTLSEMTSVLLRACVVRWSKVMHQHYKGVAGMISFLAKVQPRTPPASR